MLDESGAFAIENAEWKRTWDGNAVIDGVLDYEKYRGFRPDTCERISAMEWPCAMSLKQGISTRDVILDIERFDGTRGTIVVSSAPIRDETGKVVAAVAANMDISELRNIQAKLIEADRRKDEFLAMLAHELRNPLAPIASAAEMLKIVAFSDPKVSRASEVISPQARHLAVLVDDLLDVSRVTRGLIQLDMKVLDTKSLMDSALVQSKPLLDAKGHNLEVHYDSTCPTVIGDRNRLVQVLVNLLNNAAKYTPDAGSISLTVHREDGRFNVDVEYNRIVIEAGLLPQIFDLFTQATRTLDRAHDGLGIGLALVQTIVKLHDGEVTATSSGLGKGSRFSVSLPLAIGRKSPQS
jgi:signal transduction histidine kinase